MPQEPFDAEELRRIGARIRAGEETLALTTSHALRANLGRQPQDSSEPSEVDAATVEISAADLV